MIIEKGMKFKLTGRSGFDKSYIGDNFKVIDYCWPLILVKNLNRAERYLSQYPNNHCILNGADISIEYIESDIRQIFGTFNYGGGSKVQPVLHSDLKIGDTVVRLEGHRREIHIVCETGPHCVGLLSLNGSIGDVQINQMNNCICVDSCDRTMDDLGRVPMSFIEEVMRARDNMRRFYRLFSGEDRCCSCSFKNTCNQHGDTYHKARPYIKRTFVEAPVVEIKTEVTYSLATQQVDELSRLAKEHNVVIITASQGTGYSMLTTIKESLKELDDKHTQAITAAGLKRHGMRVKNEHLDDQISRHKGIIAKHNDSIGELQSRQARMDERIKEVDTLLDDDLTKINEERYRLAELLDRL